MMLNRLKSPLAALVACLSCTLAMAADAPAKPVLKEGWNRKQIKVFAYACTDGLLEPTLRDYKAAAAADGVSNPQPFPEQRFRDSAFPMCLCISQRVAETWTLAELENKGLQRSKGMVNEALNGGRCKPDGMLGDILKQRKERERQP